MKRKDMLVGALCGLALLFALHVWLSGMGAPAVRLRDQLGQLRQMGRVPPELEAMRRRVAADGAPREPLRDWVAAQTDDVAVSSETDTPLPGGWIRREAVLVGENAEYAAVERLLWGLAAREPRWVAESGEWTPSETPGHGHVLLAIAQLVPPPLPAGAQ